MLKIIFLDPIRGHTAMVGPGPDPIKIYPRF